MISEILNNTSGLGNKFNREMFDEHHDVHPGLKNQC